MKLNLLIFVSGLTWLAHAQNAFDSKGTAQLLTDVSDLMKTANDKFIAITGNGEHAEDAIKALQEVVDKEEKVDLRLDQAGNPTIDDDGQKEICSAYEKFFEQQETLLITMTGKGSIISRSTPLANPAKIGIRGMDTHFKPISQSLLKSLPSCKSKIEDKERLLGGKFDSTAEQFAE